MAKVIGVRFRNTGKIYHFDPQDLEIEVQDHVIVETSRGMEYGQVVTGPREVPDDQVNIPLKPVTRIASPADDERAANNREKEKQAVQVCREKIRAHGLDMKLVDVECTFDNNKILFYFTADGRIDFRELVKDLASVFKTRIELRQIGVRDETKIKGGIGVCGRALCCHAWLTDFVPVSIKMAKEQNLSLNPTKISGVCGRLMCCLKNEQETYEYLNSRMPSVGELVETEDGHTGTVSEISVLRQMVKVMITEDDDEKELKEYSVDTLAFRGKPRREGKKARSSDREKGSDSKNASEAGNGGADKERRTESPEKERGVREEEKGRRSGDEEKGRRSGSEEKSRRSGEEKGRRSGDEEKGRRSGDEEKGRRSGDEEKSRRSGDEEKSRRQRDGEKNRKAGKEDASDKDRQDRKEPSERRERRDRKNRNERRGENRNENRNENRGETRNENRGENRNENRGENRNENRGKNRNENRGENRNETRNENRSDNRNEHRNEHRGDNRSENRSEHKASKHNERSGENRPKNRNENRNESGNRERGNQENASERTFRRRRRKKEQE